MKQAGVQEGVSSYPKSEPDGWSVIKIQIKTRTTNTPFPPAGSDVDQVTH